MDYVPFLLAGAVNEINRS